MTSVKKLALIVLVCSLGKSWASPCPPVVGTDLARYKQLEVQAVDSKGEITGKKTPLSLENHKGKVTVVRLYATWCPYCKKDLQDLNAKFHKLVSEDKLDIVLVSFLSRRETDESLKLFLSQGAQELGIETKNFKWYHSPVKSADVKAYEVKKGEALFPEFRGVPYGLVFDDKGQLRFQGHFTGDADMTNKHYKMIEALASGRCS